MLRALLLLSVFAGSTAAADSMRCGTKLIVDGDTRAEVRAKCGKPEDIDKSTLLRRAVLWLNGRPVYVGDGLVEVPVEKWLYNFGPQRFMRRLKFVDGKVTAIETLGYGFL